MEMGNNSNSNSKLLPMQTTITMAMGIMKGVSFLDQISQSLRSGLQEELDIDMNV